MEKSYFVRLRKQLGIREFRETTPSGRTNEDYMEPFRGLGGVKHALAVYLMKSVPSCAIRFGHKQVGAIMGGIGWIPLPRLRTGF